MAETVYDILYLGAVFMGCMAKVNAVWELSDIWNGLMALPNIGAILFCWQTGFATPAHWVIK